MCTYMYAYAYIHVCKCIDVSGMIQKGLAIVTASKAVVDGRYFFLCKLSHTVSIFYYMYKLLLIKKIAYTTNNKR